MSSLGTGNPFTQDFRLLRGIPATLNGAAGATANNLLVQASRNDPFIRAADTGTTSPLVPAFIRLSGDVSFDFLLCSGNGSVVPSDLVELIFTNGVASPSGTTNVATDVTVGTLLLDEPIATDLVADNDPLTQNGRRVIIQADLTGRVTGSIKMTETAGDTPVIIRYRGILTVATALVAAT